MNVTLPIPMPVQLQRMRDYLAAEREAAVRHASHNARSTIKSPTAKRNARHDRLALAAIAAGHNTQAAIAAHTGMTRGTVRHTTSRLFSQGRIHHDGRAYTGDRRATLYAITE